MKTKRSTIPATYTRARQIRHWGTTYTVTPAVVDVKLGNGRQLLAVTPLNTRPNYYLIRVSSAWIGDKIHDHLDEIYDAIIDQYGEKEREREYLIEDLRERGIEPTAANTDLAGNEDRLDWPVLSLDSGCAWETVAVLKGGKWA